MDNEREPYLYVSAGEKGSGKTKALIDIIVPPYIKGSKGIPGRKVLVVDVNNEYPYRPIGADEKSIKTFMIQKNIEARRIIPYKQTEQGAKKKTISEIEHDVSVALDNFMGGMIILEDISKIVGTNMKKDLYGSMCTGRHIDCDIVTNYQSIGRVANPYVVNVMNILRLHHTKDSAIYHKKKFEDRYPIMRIAQLIVDAQYDLCECQTIKCQCGRKYFFVYINFDTNKIRGNFTLQDFKDAVYEYISENMNETINMVLNKIDPKTGHAKYKPSDAFRIVEEKLIKQYYGN